MTTFKSLFSFSAAGIAIMSAIHLASKTTPVVLEVPPVSPHFAAADSTIPTALTLERTLRACRLPPVIALDHTCYVSPIISSCEELEIEELEEKENPLLPEEANTTPKMESDDYFELIAMERPPQFPGGERALIQYFIEHQQWPKEAMDQCWGGKVVVSFVVRKDSSINDIRILRNIGADFGAEAVRLIKAMPCWEPGTINGEAVDCRMTMPISFHLDASTQDNIIKNSSFEDKQIEQKTDKTAGTPHDNLLQAEDTAPNSDTATDAGKVPLALRLFPNPSVGPVQIEFSGTAGSITVSDIMGKELLRMKAHSPDGYVRQPLDLSAFPRGMVIVRIEQSEKIIARQLFLR